MAAAVVAALVAGLAVTGVEGGRVVARWLWGAAVLWAVDGAQQQNVS